MHHPLLGWLDADADSARATIAFDGRAIAFGIEADDIALDAAVAFAATIAAALSSLDAQAREVIVADLLDTYNGGWNTYDEVQEDGRLKEVVQPRLAPDAFKARFVLNAVNVTADSCVALFYQDDGLFWGHSVVVESLDGADFSRARAQLFG